MSPRLRTLVRSAAALSLAATALAPAGAQAASAARSVKFDVPSLKGNVDIARAAKQGQMNDATTSLTAWVRLPQGYDDNPSKRWPVVYLLHGWEDSSDAWLAPKKGAIDSYVPADFPGLVVMPEGGKNWFVNWADDKYNPGNRWGDYLLEEVVPFMESNLRIAPGRANHTIGGLSMGGFGGVRALATLPSYFGHALSFSGLLDNQDFAFSQIIGVAQFGKPGYASVFGPLTGAYATSLNPKNNARDFKGSRVTAVYGTPPVATIWALDIRSRGEASLEIGAQGQARQFIDALKGSGAVVITNNRANGSHSWPSWKKDFADSIKRGLWVDPPITQTSQNSSWEYDTMQAHGNAWGLGFQFAARPSAEVTFVRRGNQLQGKGTGTVRIAGGAADADASGNGTRADCTWTLKLPFTQTLPAGC